MISIFISLAAYRYYSALAGKFAKTKWHFGLLAVVIYFGTQLLFGMFYGMYLMFTDPAALDDISYSGFSAINMVSWVIYLLPFIWVITCSKNILLRTQ